MTSFPTRDDDAYDVRCPLCGARRGAPCVYQPPAGTGEYARSQKYLETVRRVGTPTKRPHNRRIQAAGERARRRWQKEIQLRNPAASPDIRQAARAMRDFDLAEYRELVIWFRLFGDLLVGGVEG